MMLSELKTDREVFEYVKDHLLKQNQQSSYGSGCAYRGGQGMSCAVGCLIDDDHYDEELEDNDVFDGRVIDALLESVSNWLVEVDDCLSDKRILMLCLLQKIHDCTQPYTWEYDLNDLESKIFDENSDSVSDDVHLYDFYPSGKKIALKTEIQEAKDILVRLSPNV
jgi:hypothetical protein